MDADYDRTEDGLDLEQLAKGRAIIRAEKIKKHKVLTFAEFLDGFQRGEAYDPSARQLVCWAMQDGGIEDIPEEEQMFGVTQRFKIFDELYGWDEVIWKIYQFLKAGIDDPVVTGRMGLGLISPPGSGKTTLIKRLSWWLQRLSEKLSLYEIQGCPLHHNPMFLVPQHLRAETWDPDKATLEGFMKPFERKYRIRNIVGDLCVKCAHRVREEFNGEWERFPVESFTLSVQKRRGFGDFKPSNERNADIASLVGRERFGITQNPKYGYGHPDAWDLGSAIIPQSSRGLLHVIEGLIEGNDPHLLRTLLSLMSDKYIIIEGSPFPLTYIDTFVLMDSNLNGFKWFDGLQGDEALQDRIEFIFGYYLLDWRDEVKIYKKLVENEDDFSLLRKCHKDPRALELAAKFAVMTRLSKSTLVSSFVRQMEILSDESTTTDDGKEIDRETLINEGKSHSDIGKHSGMFGPSPRSIVSALDKAVASEGEMGCLTLKKTIGALRKIFEERTRAGMSPEERTRMSDFLKGGADSIFPIYEKADRKVVNEAFLRTYGDLSEAMFEEYMGDVELWCEIYAPIKGWRVKLKKKDALGKVQEPNEKRMKKIEAHWNPPVPDQAVLVHRTQVLYAKGMDKNFCYGVFMPLTNACDETLLADSKDVLLAVISENGVKKEDVEKRKMTLLENLLGNDPDIGGHCKICAREKVEHVRELLTK